MQIELNIGLNVKGVYNEQNKEKFLNLISDKLQSKNSYRFDFSTYEGQKEYTLIACLNVPNYKMIKYIKELCVKTEQECIAVRYRTNSGNLNGLLIYNPFFNGVKYKFNKEFFIPFTYCGQLVHSIGYSMHNAII